MAYAAAGQKWLCGADGTGLLWLDPEFGERVRTIAPGYMAFEDATRGLESTFRAGGRRFDAPIAREAVAFSLGAYQTLAAAGFDELIERAADLADTFAAALRGRRLHGRAARAQHAGGLRVPGARGRARAARGPRRGRPQPARLPVPARVGRGLERRVRPRAAAGGAVNAVCVYCGSSFGSDPVYLEATKDLARTLAGRGIRVVYGGASVGLMGALADATLEAGGEVVGVIPQQLVDREIAHTGLTELHVVQTMHQRKALMAELSDAFVALPGGIGTLEELIEIFTWEQLGLHSKPLAVLNTVGYYDGLTAFLDHTVEQGFHQPQQRAKLRRRRRRRGPAGPVGMSWWRGGAIYQVYPRSFQDSDGDGTGDLEGVRQRLPYLKWLGVDGVWLSPFYRSPMADFGYDVSDHRDVDPIFGTLEDFDALAADARALGLKLILDYVPNHTSIEHPWFRERPDFYLWADEVPNNWVSATSAGPRGSRMTGASTTTRTSASSPTSTGATPRCGRRCSTSCASGARAAPTASGSTPCAS